MVNSRRVGLSYIRSTRAKSGWVAVSTVLYDRAYETKVFAAKPGGFGIKSYLELDASETMLRTLAKIDHREMVDRWEAKWHGRVPPPDPPTRIVVRGN